MGRPAPHLRRGPRSCEKAGPGRRLFCPPVAVAPALPGLGGAAGVRGGPWSHVLAVRLLTRPAAPPGWPWPESAEPGAHPAAASARPPTPAAPAAAPPAPAPPRAAPRRSQPQPPDPEDYERTMRRLRRWAFAALLLQLLPQPGE